MIIYRFATTDDNEQLIALTSASGMSGEVSLRIDRKPDFFRLLTMRGESKVFVAEDDHQIVGSLCVSAQKVYVGGEMVTLQYVGDFKVAEPYRNKSVGARLCNELAEYVVSIDADLAFLNVSLGNKKPFSFFRERPGFPDFDNIGIFTIHQFLGKRQKTSQVSSMITSEDVSEELIEFFNRKYAGYQLGSVITKESLTGTEILTIRKEEKIIAAMCLADTMEAKQNIVTGLSRRMKYLLRAINICSSVAGISKMPSLHAPVRMLYIKYLAAQSNDKDLVTDLITYARNLVYARSYSFVSIGLHERDPLNTCISGLFRLRFKSVGMLISLKNNRTLIDKVIRGIPFEDYSLV